MADSELALPDAPKVVSVRVSVWEGRGGPHCLHRCQPALPVGFQGCDASEVSVFRLDHFIVSARIC